MIFRISSIILIISICVGRTYALEPDEILIIANNDIEESISLTRYYCSLRSVPDKNILALSLGASLKYMISRNDYEKQLVEPIRTKFFNEQLIGQIKCLLTIYGVPVRVRGRGVLEGQEDKLKELNRLAEQEKETLEKFKQAGSKNSAKYKQANRRLAGLQDEVGW